MNILRVRYHDIDRYNSFEFEFEFYIFFKYLKKSCWSRVAAHYAHASCELHYQFEVEKAGSGGC